MKFTLYEDDYFSSKETFYQLDILGETLSIIIFKQFDILDINRYIKYIDNSQNVFLVENKFVNIKYYEY